MSQRLAKRLAANQDRTSNIALESHAVDRLLEDLGRANHAMASLEHFRDVTKMVNGVQDSEWAIIAPAIECLFEKAYADLAACGDFPVASMERIDVDSAGFLQKAGHKTVEFIKKLLAFIAQMIVKIGQYIKSIFIGLTADLHRAESAVSYAKHLLKDAPPSASFAIPLSERAKGILGAKGENLGKYQHAGMVASADFKVLHSLINEALKQADQLTETTEKSAIGKLIDKTLKLSFTGFETEHTGTTYRTRSKAQVDGVRQTELVFTEPKDHSSSWGGLAAFRELVDSSHVAVYKDKNQQSATNAESVVFKTAELSTMLGAMENFVKACLLWAREFKSVFDEIESTQKDVSKKIESESKRVEPLLGNSDPHTATEAERSNEENYKRLLYVQTVNQLNSKYLSFLKDHGKTIIAVTDACRNAAKGATASMVHHRKMVKAEIKQSE